MNAQTILNGLIHQLQLAECGITHRMDEIVPMDNVTPEPPEYDVLALILRNVRESLGTYNRLNTAVNDLEV